jgi:hypothetical protein
VTTVTRRANDLLHAKHENSTALVQNFLTDGTVLVHDSSNRGKGSPAYVDSARLLGAAELKTIDEFITQTHSDGGSLSVRQIADELNNKHPAVLISNSAIRYALIHYLGYSWGDVKLRKCQSDPDRVDVKRTYLVDFARALKMQDVDKTHVMVFLDESYIHQNHAPKRSWCKFNLVGGEHINRGTSKGKRLIILVSHHLALSPVHLVNQLGRCVQHAITQDGPLVTRDEQGRPIIDYTFGTTAQSKDIAETKAGGLTAECLWTASQSKGDCQSHPYPLTCHLLQMRGLNCNPCVQTTR